MINSKQEKEFQGVRSATVSDDGKYVAFNATETAKSHGSILIRKTQSIVDLLQVIKMQENATEGMFFGFFWLLFFFILDTKIYIVCLFFFVDTMHKGPESGLQVAGGGLEENSSAQPNIQLEGKKLYICCNLWHSEFGCV